MLLGYGKTSFVLPFVRCAGGHMATEQEIQDNYIHDMAVAGISKRIIPNLARERGLNWWSIDTGYVGNHAEKRWLRVTCNGWQDTGAIQPRNDVRLRRLKLDRKRFARGKHVLLVPPHPKVCWYYDLPPYEQWIDQCIHEIAKFTSRPIMIRHRPSSRHDRQTTDRFIDVLQQDVNCVVTYNSNSAVEALLHMIPVVVLGESAARPLSGQLEDIEDLSDINPDQQEAWLRHLSYRQFNRREIAAGVAWRIANE